MLFLLKINSMKFYYLAFIFLLFFSLTSCFQEHNKSDNKTINLNNTTKNSRATDSHTLSNYQDVTITNSHLNLKVDFENKILKGFVTHDFIKKTDTNILVLDSKYLEIDSVTDGIGNKLNYELGKFDELLGTAVKIQLLEDSKKVTLFYNTTRFT